MNIRLAHAAELPILEALARAIWPSTYKTIISAAQIEFMLDWMYSTKTLLQQLEEGHEFYILESGGTDSGFMALEWVSFENTTKIKINKLYVLPSMQGNGAGRLLIDKAIERAKATNASQLYLQVNKANKAKDFYLRTGFQIDQEAVFDIGNGFVMDDYIMTRAL